MGLSRSPQMMTDVSTNSPSTLRWSFLSAGSQSGSSVLIDILDCTALICGAQKLITKMAVIKGFW
jgi:hypothetical protein